MAYCRWSDDRFRCELYCYFDGEDYVTHVGRYRATDEPPPAPNFLGPDDGFDAFFEWAAANKALCEWVNTAPREMIGGPHDGACFRDCFLEDFRKRLVALRGDGYRFPDEVLERVDEELMHKESELIMARVRNSEEQQQLDEALDALGDHTGPPLPTRETP